MISVILTTINGVSRGFIREAVESVLRQTDDNFELIIVDDGSVDSTPEVCRSFSDPRVRYIWKENTGPAAARNVGIRESRGDLICFLDDDDAWLPEKLARQRAVFAAADPKPGLVYTAVLAVTREGQPMLVQSHPAGGDFYRWLFFDNPVDALSSAMVSREALERVGTFREDVFDVPATGTEDRDLWIRIARQFPVMSVDEPLTRYRIHEHKISTKHRQMENSELLMLRTGLAEAPLEIRNEEKAIYRAAYLRFAIKRFSLGHYAEFREYFGKVLKSGGPSLKLLWRFPLSFVPPLVTLGRILKRAVRRLSGDILGGAPA